MVARAYFSIGFDDENTHSIKMIDAPNDAKQVFLDTLSVSFVSSLCLSAGPFTWPGCERFMCGQSSHRMLHRHWRYKQAVTMR